MPPETSLVFRELAAAWPDGDPEEKEGRLSSRVRRLAGFVRRMHEQQQRGDLASLRRMNPDRPFEVPAFGRILARVAPEVGLEEARRIALFVKILAISTSGDALRTDRLSLGRAMEEARVSERRVQVLMTARGPALDDAVVRLARRLVREGALPFDEIGRLILGGKKDVEQARFTIARGFWGGHARREDAEGAAPGLDNDDTIGDAE